MLGGIEKNDCMVQAVASVTKRPETVDELRRIRQQQMENSDKSLEVVQRELVNLLALFEAIGENVSISLITISQLTELDDLLVQGKKILVGMPQGQSSTPPHIVHIEERHEQVEQIDGDMVIPAWRGYRSDQEEVEYMTLMFSLLEQRKLQLFIIE